MTTGKIYSPCGRKWQIPDPYDFSCRYLDNSVISVPVRKYLYGNGLNYTVLCCVDIDNPEQVFYDVKVCRYNEISIPIDLKHIKILHHLVNKFPISVRTQARAEQTLINKIENLRQQIGMVTFTTEIQSEALSAKDGKCFDNVMEGEYDNKTVFNAADDDDDGCFGGVLGIYARGD
ncbi:hypothetical protein ACF0H5_006397 [Mactra antiquata]